MFLGHEVFIVDKYKLLIYFVIFSFAFTYLLHYEKVWLMLNWMIIICVKGRSLVFRESGGRGHKKNSAGDAPDPLFSPINRSEFRAGSAPG